MRALLLYLPDFIIIITRIKANKLGTKIKHERELDRERGIESTKLWRKKVKSHEKRPDPSVTIGALQTGSRTPQECYGSFATDIAKQHFNLTPRWFVSALFSHSGGGRGDYQQVVGQQENEKNASGKIKNLQLVIHTFKGWCWKELFFQKTKVWREERGSIWNRAPLHLAAARNNIAALKLLLQAGGQVNSYLRWSSSVLATGSKKEETVLLTAIRLANVETVRFLLNSGADPYLTGRAYESGSFSGNAHSYAAQTGNIEKILAFQPQQQQQQNQESNNEVQSDAINVPLPKTPPSRGQSAVAKSAPSDFWEDQLSNSSEQPESRLYPNLTAAKSLEQICPPAKPTRKSHSVVLNPQQLTSKKQHKSLSSLAFLQDSFKSLDLTAEEEQVSGQSHTHKIAKLFY